MVFVTRLKPNLLMLPPNKKHCASNNGILSDGTCQTPGELKQNKKPTLTNSLALSKKAAVRNWSSILSEALPIDWQTMQLYFTHSGRCAGLCLGLFSFGFQSWISPNSTSPFPDKQAI
jgi:hypothetical protein